MGRNDLIHAGREKIARTTELVESFDNCEMDEEETGFNPEIGLKPVWYRPTKNIEWSP
jgi:hypothetical protein